MRRFHRYSDEVYEFLYENASSHTNKELRKLLKEKFDLDVSKQAISTLCKRNNLKCKYENKNLSHSNKETHIGNITIKDGYYAIKTGKNVNQYEYLHRKIYEDYYNVKLSKDMCIIFLDGDRNNLDINNLRAIHKRSVNVLRNSKFYSNDAEITKMGCLMAELKIKMNDIERSKNETN